jgi:hypothetical protein
MPRKILREILNVRLFWCVCADFLAYMTEARTGVKDAERVKKFDYDLPSLESRL